ncbi:hypothetical protein PAECIP111893_04152 [Paenibacillus plantiphilus]|uniref:Transglutaminase-like domain-containing protein n=1 Tax=Paenibacillus plantiphilus TaxID=2905650 RepID=A0ABM9CKA9_9BACL|nr:transglutaminase domain-containing protein [Paenibacillus plantiphilus]CAH1216726.1 hypothetical protein PAECIP111893_04152 [Paenibacillus plantiphilus]
MSRLLARVGLILAILVSGLGADFRYSPAKPNAHATLEALKLDLIEQLLAQKPVIQAVYTGGDDELKSSLDDLLRDVLAADDYMAYIVDSYLYTIRTWGPNARIKLSVRYRESLQQTKQVDARIIETLRTIIKPTMSERSKVKAIHDWIVGNVAYDSSLQRYTAYEALTTGLAVCQGYSLLAHRMLKAAGINTLIIEGKVDTGNHVWNMVKLGSKWKHLDITWDDPLPDRPGTVSYDYFLKSDKEMKEDHAWVKPYPVAD